ncbi:MAG: serine hydrolase, partial [Burkholderiales bacterium]|nr:serine hydrolase [Burkholderiales bacterium]
ARMLLSHTSSLRDDAGYNFPAEVSMQSFLVPGGAHYGDGKQWAGQAESAKAGDFAPGHFFHYVNLNWGVLGSVMEAVTGQRFDVLMQELVLRPLHITGAYHPESLSAHDVADLAVLYRKQKNEVWDVHGPWVAQTDDLHAQVPEPRAALAHYVPGTNATLFSPQGGLRISVRGLSHIMLMLMNQGESDGVRFLQASTVQTMLSQQWRYDPLRLNGDDYRGLFQSWGLGVQRFMDVSAAHYGDRLLPPSVQTTSNGFSAIGHLGFAYGLESGFFFDPRSKNGMIYVIGGVGADPETHLGNYSSLSIWEEEILSALYQHLQ